MNTKLENVTTQYRKFNVNQVLTEGQLNEFLDYFEDQDRLSRTHLSGVGVASGFKSMYIDESVTEETIKLMFKIDKEQPIDLNDYLDTIAITQGAGITTDGDLMTLRRKTLKHMPESIETVIDFGANAYKYYKKYEAAKDYGHFIINNEPVSLLEIITQQDYDFLIAQGISISDFKPVKDIQKLNEKIVILYLESYSNEESPCQDADCDNAGAEQVSNLRVLLADQNEIKNIIDESEAKDTLYQLRNVYEDLFDKLHNIEARRVILDPGVSTAPQLKSKFIDAISAVSELSEGFTRIAQVFNVNLNLGNQYLKDKLEALLYTIPSGADDYQYRYDLLKDLIDTHNEIRSLVLHLHAECCPSISSFPKHLLLGPLGAKLELGENTPLRHGFYHSPTTTGDDENYERIVMLANRFAQKINGFRAYSGPVKITPSYLNVRLGDKAIPFYYNVDQPLLRKWNYEKTKTDRETYNLSYHTANLAGEDFVQNPLDYNIDNHDFYRIEGHLGLPFETAVQNINDLKTKYGLAFDVTVLLLNNEKRGSGEVSEPRKLSIPELRAQVLSISNDISKATGDSKSTLQNLTKLDSQLKLLNKAKFDFDPEFAEEITIVKEDPRKKEITTELLKDFLERKSGLEHMAGVRPGDTFVLIAESETNNLVLADFTLPYLCCSKEKPNIPPLAKDDYASCMIGKTVTISVLDNDYDADNDSLTVVKKSDPSYGTVVLNSSGIFTYTHDGSANLEDSFTYCVNDGRDDSNIATVFIKVKSAPVAVNDHASTSNGGYVDIAVKDNDYDLGNTPLSVFINTQPAHGTATLRPDGKIRYTHDKSNTLTDSFTYHINDGELDSNIATVTIKIGPPPCNSGMDVVFIFDYTGSMGGQIEAAKTGASSIITTIQNQSSPNAYRLGIVLADETDSRTNSSYSSAAAYTSLPVSQRFVNPGIGSKFQWITAMEVMSENNVTSFTNQLGKINNPAGGLSLGWGVGGPEPTDMALSRVVEHDFAGTFRNNVAKYVIIITDITPGGNDDIANSVDVAELNRLKNICLAKSIKVIVLGAGVDHKIEGKYIWRELANGTGGSWNSSYNASAIQTAIINGCGG
ncbi:Ig-like domain-containing protein [Chryseobacterium salviniae]|uniref:Ig-like domain-containing protein n=1 Tax=Chryseobacterium salviniae TaxID=3101750 RepID=A0ABU6HMV4_9FLAO|nr:Ig-like domain-containing protein [Chryseobacterium sp. T9W2-O]MEC3874303.1 Ig-like domain-containing protein [Chryseobacterium sp. T9W2-O]